MLVGFVEELEVQPAAGAAPFHVLLRHRDALGKLYTVSVDARHIVTHNLDAVKGPDPERLVFRFPNLELAVFMDGDILRVCRRDEVLQFLRGENRLADERPDGRRLM